MLTAYAPTRVKSRRDTQRSKLYRAENVLTPFSEPLPTVKHVERFTKKVWSSRRLRKAFPQAMWTAPRVKDGRGTRIARGGIRTINIPLWARSTHVVLHELAHTVTLRTYGNVPAHGWEYCSVYLRMTLYILGREAHDALKASFKANKVRFRQPRKRQPLSPERREQLAATLAAARAKRLPHPLARQIEIE